jgi:CRISPR-associated endonuclease Csn1
MKELNWGKFNKLGLTEVIEDRDGQRIRHIKDWTKRNDHRHHAMDALTIAFTKDVFIQYFNNINARYDKNSNAFAIEEKYFEDRKVKLPMDNFRAEAKKHLENTLISIKAKNKVVTINVNSSKKRGGVNKKQQLTPRGQLHNETVYGSLQQYVTKEEKVGSSFTEEQIMKVGKKVYREALLKRLKEFGNDPKKAFTGKNSLEKNPVWLDDLHAKKVPERVKIVTTETILTTRKAISPDLKVDKVIDVNIRKILMSRLKEYDNDPKKAFSNLDENPIWLNKEKGIAIKRVTITGISNGQALHEKRDKDGHLLLDVDGKPQPVDFVSTSNNHHVAIYKDQKGELQENVVSFFEATTRKGLGLPVIDKEYKKSEGWEFLFSMKQNEYFVFPNKETGFDPNEVDLMNPDNYSLISPRLFRVQKITKKDYFFRHHLETMVEYNNALKDITWIRCGLSEVTNILKVRVNHIGQIVSVGEY